MTTAEIRVNQAASALAAANSLLEQSLSWLKEQSLNEKGRVSVAKLDLHQVVCFDLALNVSELTCAKFALDYAARVRAAKGGGDDPLYEEHLALLCSAEALSNVRGRISARPADYGLDRGSVSEAFESSTVREFCERELSVEQMTGLAESMRNRDGSSGEYMLEENPEMMRTMFRKFANDVVMPLAEEVHRHDLLIPEKILTELTELGCFGLSIPEEYGGLHEDSMGMIVVTEELSRGSLGAAGSLITRPEILGRALIAGGTEEQKQHWLPMLAAGDPLCAVAVTEPDYGSDVGGMRFKATKTEQGWVLNGAKTWCTFGGKAGVLLVLARTDPDLSKGHKGLSVFLVEKPVYDGHDFEYVQEGGGTLAGRAIATIGYRGMHSYECFFENFTVPDSALLGGEEGLGKGFYYIMAGFSGGRIQTAARAVGVMQAAFEAAFTYAGERKVFATPIIDYQLTAVKLARMAAWLCASRQFTYGVARLMDQGGGQMEASMVKLFASKTAEWLTREALQIYGGMGYAEETAVSRYFLDARVLSIFEGAEEVLALRVIARSLVASA